MAKHCPTCGRSSDDVRFYGEFCEVCSSGKLKAKLPTMIEAERCKVCSKIRTKEGWKEEDRQSLHSIISQRIKGYKIHLIGYSGNKAQIYVTDQEGKEPLSAETELEIKYLKRMCDSCNKRAGGYYEAVIQLRGDPDRIDRFIEKVNRYVEARGEFIARVDRADNGMNVFVSSKGVVSAFISERDIKANRSYTLNGLKSGKKVYRHTYAIRL